ncbi:uncharacterized protein LOC18430337 isoform X1 [Amborella trichopoda]|uniref:Uncharacterized protein n=1 Tax=Amborella trichopoda TaxID=13333 RepID=W1P2U9_AMBTC|nr:uncharacterized protein LOC18430337 isoform X1 [Amborella trichopoda]ERN02233.1 hypothetical protein AMTR_s00045p00222230 [Amborella trichopoda]|eukprot:XP_006840558.3 uncharacterized protein LOC18430337 isoform X1 [Amborella trichopoda]
MTMSTGARLELSSASPDGHTYGSSYPSGHRGCYAAGSLERSSSFRDGMENRTLTPLSNASRNHASSHGDAMSFSLVDPLSMGDLKFARPGELRKVISMALGVTSEDPSLGTVQAKSLPPLALDELKRVKAGIHENFVRARERVKNLNEATSKLEKYGQATIPRKRGRIDVSPSERVNALSVAGGSIVKMASQSQLTSNASEDRSKSAVPNRRMRASAVDLQVDTRDHGTARPSGASERDRDLFRLGNGGLIQSEDNSRPLASGGDGWEKKKLRKKRSGMKIDGSGSTGVSVNKVLDGDRELKRGIQPRLGGDSRSRLSNGHGFRSGLSGIVGASKSDANLPQGSSSFRALQRSEHDSGSISNDRKDHFIGLDKERVTPKSITKPTIREDNSAASPTSMAKGNTTRGPRSSPATLVKSSSSVPRAVGNSEGWENPSTSKVQPVSGVGNRKRPMSGSSSSPPVAKWGGQRPPKMARVARTNLVPPVSNREAPTSSEGFASTDAGSKLTSTDGGLGPSRRLSKNTQQVKLIGDSLSSAGLSESEESGAVETKPKEKGRRKSAIDENVGQIVPKVSTVLLPSRKNKVFAEESLGDGVRRQGRSGRGSYLRAGMSPTMEKDDAVNAKQLRSVRQNSDKIESKVGRPPNKRSSDRKAFTRPRHGISNGLSEVAVESYDDHEELLAAASAALSDSCQACSGLFWKHMEPIFAFVSAEDITFLKQQIQMADASNANISPFDADQNPKDAKALDVKQLSLALVSGDICSALPNENAMVDECGQDVPSKNETIDTDAYSGNLDNGEWHNTVIPLSQRLLSALIVEDNIEEHYRSSRIEDESLSYMNNCFLSDTSNKYTESEFKNINGLESGILPLTESSNCNGLSLRSSLNGERSASNGYIAPNIWKYNDELVDRNGLHSDFENVADVGQSPNVSQSTEVDYHQMSLDGKILLELHSIGLFPEVVPDLAHREYEINEDIAKCKEELREQLLKNKKELVKLEKAVTEKIEPEKRERQHLALNKLVGLAYEKYMGFWGPNPSSTKSASNKIAKQSVQAFVKKTLARCRKFEETGQSCFDEPAYRDILCSVPLQGVETDYIDDTIEEAGHVYADSAICPLESNTSGAASLASDPIPCLVLRKGQNINNIDRDSTNAFQAANNSTEPSFVKEETWSSKVKRREVLLDEVVGSTVSRASSAFGGALSGGAKGKRSERDREGKGHNKEISSRNGTAKCGRPALSNTKGDRKNKPKPKQKTAQLSASVNGLLGPASGMPKAIVPPNQSTKIKNERDFGSTGQDSLNDTDGPLDFSQLPLPGIDDLAVTDGLDAQSQDIGSWLNVDDEGLQDHDYMGLEIPMDDLSELHMMV